MILENLWAACRLSYDFSRANDSLAPPMLQGRCDPDRPFSGTKQTRMEGSLAHSLAAALDVLASLPDAEVQTSTTRENSPPPVKDNAEGRAPPNTAYFCFRSPR